MAYFFHPGGSASQRRTNEARNSFHIRAVVDGKEVEVISYWAESCRHVYFDFKVYVNGVKRDLRALRKLPEVEFETVQ